MEEEGFTASPTAEPSGQKADHAAVLPGGGGSGQRWQAIDAQSPLRTFSPSAEFERKGGFLTLAAVANVLAACSGMRQMFAPLCQPTNQRL